MPRFRRLNGGLWGDSEDKEPAHDGIDDFPIDEAEQDELIQTFETRNYEGQQSTIKVLSLLYLLCAGAFLMMATKTKSRNVSSMLLGGMQSIVCSCATLRYKLVNDFRLFKKLKIHISNGIIDILNYGILILLLWVTVNEFQDERALQFLFQVPLMLCIIASLMKKWATEVDYDIDNLRGLKYKYKSA